MGLTGTPVREDDAFGRVMLTVNRLDGREYAIKKVRLSARSPSLNAKILREVTTLSTLAQANTVIGSPLVKGACVHATVEEQGYGKKVIVFKKKKRKGYRRWKGYRARLSLLRMQVTDVPSPTDHKFSVNPTPGPTWSGETGTSFLPEEAVERAAEGNPIEKAKLAKDATAAFKRVAEAHEKLCVIIAPLPGYWVLMVDWDKGTMCYYNVATKQKTFNKPR